MESDVSTQSLPIETDRPGPPEASELDRYFGEISTLMQRVAGVHLTPKKRELVRGRIGKRIRDLGLDGYGAYLELVRSEEGGDELNTMVNLLTTNKTSFFREDAHFDFLEEELTKGAFADRRRLTFWSSACSTGQEPYSLAILLSEVLEPQRLPGVRILATDINTEALRRARDGVYDESVIEDVPPALRQRYFSPVEGSASRHRVVPGVRSLVRFARLNLVGEWPMDGPFDVIFCRNVMIYFDEATRQGLIDRFVEILAPGGYYLTGHSESLSSFEHGLEYVRPATYRK